MRGPRDQKLVAMVDEATKKAAAQIAHDDGRSLSNWLERLVLREIEREEQRTA